MKYLVSYMIVRTGEAPAYRNEIIDAHPLVWLGSHLEARKKQGDSLRQDGWDTTADGGWRIVLLNAMALPNADPGSAAVVDEAQALMAALLS